MLVYMARVLCEHSSADKTRAICLSVRCAYHISLTDCNHGTFCCGERSLVQVEVTVMTAFAFVNDPERRKHFVDLFDKGQTETFKLVVMRLVGPSIEDLRRFYLCTDFTLVDFSSVYRFRSMKRFVFLLSPHRCTNMESLA